MTTNRKVTSSEKPFMSEYDKIVELRLQTLEEQSHNHTSNSVDEDRLSALESRFEDLIQKLQRKMSL